MEAENQKGQVLMIHGFAHTTYCWTDIATQLVNNGYTCVLEDLPDFGCSSRETEDMKKLPREDIMHALMVHLSDKPWYVAGHSMGGFVAESIYDKYPESVNNKDQIILKSAKKTLIENLPENSACYEVEGGGHLFIENYADETAEITLEFLKNNPSR